MVICRWRTNQLAAESKINLCVSLRMYTLYIKETDYYLFHRKLNFISFFFVRSLVHSLCRRTRCDVIEIAFMPSAMRKAIRSRQTWRVCNVQTCECKFYSVGNLKGAGIGISLFIRSAFSFAMQARALIIIQLQKFKLFALLFCVVSFEQNQ